MAELGSEAAFASGDLAAPEQCREIIRTCGECFGHLDGS
jgi:hypothetical protein